jgi:uncharacterized protein
VLKNSILLFISLASLAVLATITRAENLPLPPKSVVKLQVGDRTINAELVSTIEDRQRGLMFRKNLAPESGMLFLYPAEENHAVCMWMKNTTIPLSAAFLDDSGRVLNIADMQPHSETAHCVSGSARYVLEVNQGMFAAAGVMKGARIGGLPRAP